MGEGVALIVNEKEFAEREILREKGTNSSKFPRGEVDKYTWVDVGSSFLPSEINAAILWAQFEYFGAIQAKRKRIFDMYFSALLPFEADGHMRLPVINDYANLITPSFTCCCRQRKIVTPCWSI